MRSLFVFLTFILSVIFVQFASADESNRTVNPGDEPNLVMTSQGADVAAQGTGCRDCLARLKGGRISDVTAAKAREGSGRGNGAEGSEKGGIRDSN